MTDIIIIKIGGQAAKHLDTNFVNQVKAWQAEGYRLIIVHGGGYAISQLMEEEGIPVEKADGLRVTSQDSMPLVEKALVAVVGRSLKQDLEAAGLKAKQIVSQLPDLVLADFLDQDKYGFVGTVSKVMPDVLHPYLEQGMIPLIPSLGYTKDGHKVNINADYLATAMATNLSADQLVLMTDVPGVKEDGQVLAQLTTSQVPDKIDQGVITGGMIPKVESAKATVQSGVSSVIISDNLTTGTRIIEG